jgi:hypothetical protein
MATLGFYAATKGAGAVPTAASSFAPARGDHSGFCLLARLMIWLTRNAR